MKLKSREKDKVEDGRPKRRECEGGGNEQPSAQRDCSLTHIR